MKHKTTVITKASRTKSKSMHPALFFLIWAAFAATIGLIAATLIQQ